MEDEKKSKKDKKKNDAVVKNTIEINPSLEEAVSPTAVFSFGRMNPPTIGHEKLVDKINAVAKQNNAMPHLYLSQSYDSKKNPLPYATKIALAKKAFGSMVVKSRSKTLMQVAKELEDMGHTKLIMVAGSDRVAEFEELLNKYNGKDYTFDSIEVVSAGERDPDAEGAAGMSASKMRAAAAAGDEKAFKSGLPKKLQSSASKVYQAVRDGMQIAEEMEIELGEDLMFEAVLSVAARRKRAMSFKKAKSKIMRGRKIAAKKMASPEKLKLRSRKKAIEVIRKKVAGAKGTDYKNLSPSEKMSIDKKVEKKKGLIAKIAKKQFQGVKKAEKERLAKVRKGPAKESVNEAVAPEVKKGDTITVSKNERQYKMGGIVDPKTKLPSESDKMVVQKITKSSKGRKAHLTYQDSKKRGGYAIYLDNIPDFMSVTVESVNEEFENLFEREDKDIGDKKGSQPAKYHSGLAKSTKQKRDAQFRKAAEKDSDDASAYPDKHAGDSDAVTKTSTHTKRYHQMFGKESTVKHDQRFKRYRVNMVKPVELDEKGFIEEVDYMLDDVLNEMFEEVLVEKSLEGLKKKAEKSGISYGILKKVYDRGMAAWRTGHRPGAGQEQWAYARVNSFITKGKGTWGKADADLAAKVRGEEVELGEADDFKPHMMYDPKTGKGYKADTMDDHLRMKKMGYTHDAPKEEVDIDEGAVDTAKAAIKREKEADKKKHDNIMDRARLADTKATNKKEANSWRTDGHYLENGEEWDGDQHAYEGEVYTGAEHGPDSKRLYHYKELSPSIRAKIDSALKEEKEEKEEEIVHDNCGTPECCGQCDTTTDDVNESFTSMINDTMFANKFSEQTAKDGFVPSVVESSDVDESKLGLMLNKDKYKKAAELVKKERAKDKTHSVGYWAAEVIRMNSLKLDPRILAKMVDEEYGAGEEGTDELNAKYKKDTPGQ